MGGLLAAGLLAAPAAAAAPARTATPIPQPSRAGQHELAGGGSITGVVSGTSAAPLEGICVTAVGPSGGGLGMTRQDGRFLISGLRPGGYSLRYRDCGHPGRYLTQWYGGTLTQAGSRSVLVSGPGPVPVTQVTLRRPVLPASLSVQSARSPLARVLAGVPGGRRASLAPGKSGRISGKVTDQSGHPLQGICVLVQQQSGFGYDVARTGLRGLYTTAELPPGRYYAAFYAGCGNSGNWLTQVYKNTDNLLKPTLISVRAGKTTRDVNAVLRPGGEISGTLTNAAGAKLSNICAGPVAASKGPQYQLILGAVSRAGVFHVRGVPAGSYRMVFGPCNPTSAYALVWWKNSATQRHARLIRVRNRQLVTHIDQVIPLGGKITGVVTAGTRSGPRLAGICVVAAPPGGRVSESDFTATRANGTYVLKGLTPGRYQLQFSPGCNNEGNYLTENYPGRVAVSYGKTDAGINGVLPLGAAISGTVTDSRGHPLGGICVTAIGGSEDQYGNGIQTAANGSYTINQLESANYVIQFSGGCGSSGSYAPQGYNGTNVNVPQEVAVGAAQHVTGINAAMQPGATIEGRVTSSTGRALGGVCVFVTTPGIETYTGVISVASAGPFPAIPAVAGGLTVRGRYQFRDLQPGQYQLAFFNCAAKGDLAEQWYTARRGPGPAAIVFAGAQHPTGGINVVLEPGGAISGTIKSASGRKIPGCVLVANVNRNVQLPVNEALGLGGGRYEVTGLPPGAYHVTFPSICTGYATQWYSRRGSPAGAARVIVRAGHVTTAINAALTAGGSISGVITSAATHAGVGNICVAAQNVAQFEDFGFGISTGKGHYVLHGLNSGRYKIEFDPCSGGASAGQVRTSQVTVVAGRQTRGINARLGAGGSIQGHVTAGPSAAPGQALCVDAFSVSGGFSNSAITDSAGQYSIPNLPAGRYLVYVGDPACLDGPYNVAPQWYPDKHTRAGAIPVAVTSGGVTSGIDANLALDGSITGTVTGAGGARLTGVCVSAVGTAGAATPVLAVTSTGGYTIGDLNPGRYRVEFRSGCGAAGYATQWWRRASSARTATIITVAAGSTVTGISATLRKG
jgi:hypothetical protein